jgi:holliday junction DNA helicase RuvA
LVGFLSPADRAFFRLFTTVKGIGFRKALRALVRQPGEVAAAIVNKDAKFLVALPEIGRRTSETIIVELSGKVDEWASRDFAPTAEAPALSSAAAEALAVLTQLGERRADATAIIERVLAVAPELETPEAIIQQAYRLKAAGR